MSFEENKGLFLAALATPNLGPIVWQIRRGECVTLCGESGSGKSLLLRAIADLDPHGGEVLLDGVSANAMPAHLWRRRVALLPAEPSWWGERVGHHFETADSGMLSQLGFTAEVMNWEIARCSTGERQRLALLRMLQQAPEVLLLDEPTAALDPQSVARVEALVREYRQRHAAMVIWVSHDPAQRARVGQRHFCISGTALQEMVS